LCVKELGAGKGIPEINARIRIKRKENSFGGEIEGERGAGRIRIFGAQRVPGEREKRRRTGTQRKKNVLLV